MSNSIHEITYWRHTSAGWQKKPGAAITEISVSLSVNGDVWLSFMCTPINLEAMAVGFLYNEGIIDHKDELADVRICDSGDLLDVWLHHAVQKPERWRRTSGCTGGTTSVTQDWETDTPPINIKTILSTERPRAKPIRPTDQPFLTPQQITKLADEILQAQSLYQISGGVHSSAISDGKRILLVAEDIGRHNTLDKIAGQCLLDGIQTQQCILITTGRISSEMLQKAWRIGAAIVISRTAPSLLAIEMAEKAGITLIGYARRDRFNVYTHHQRFNIQ